MKKHSAPAAQTRRHCNATLVALAVLCLSGTGMAQTAPNTAPAAPTLLVVGDSISAEYGLTRGTGWVSLLQQRLDAAKSGWRVINASISGDTTAGGRSRLPALLERHKPRVLVIELGANDALRGLPLPQTRDNLTAMIRTARKAGSSVLLLGMQVPPNYGADYTRQFAQAFVDVSRTEKTALVPFLLKGVADRPDSTQWFQQDRIHPNAKAQPNLLENVWPELKRLTK